MKMLIRLLVFLILALGIVLALNFSKIQRLMTVNTLFDEGRIVENFSNMDAAFLHRDLEIGEPQPWEEDIQLLPETVTIADETRQLSEVLEELETTALVIIKDGKLIHESYYKGTEKDDLRISWSVAKSFMSGLYGKALENGQIESLDDPADKYVPSLKGSAYGGVALRHILNMSSGVVFNEDYMDPKSDINDMGRVLGLGGSMDKYAATLKDSYYTPGESWQYVSIDTHVAAMALRAATGKTLHELFEETYGAHLGFGKSPFYLTDGKDVAFALGGLNLRTRDYAKFGQLFLQDGQWKGEQIIPADWVADSTKNHAPIFHPDRGTGYGYQWWVPMPQEGIHEDDFFAVGIYGQYVYVNPRLNVVIAKNAAHRTFTENGKSGQTSIEDNIDMFRSLAEEVSVASYLDALNEFRNSIDILNETEYNNAFLKALGENPIDKIDVSQNDIYRFLWLRTFHRPAVFTLRYSTDGESVLNIKMSDGSGGYLPGEVVLNNTISISKNDASKLVKMFYAQDLCNDVASNRGGFDGSQWVFQSATKQMRCESQIWTPDEGSLHDIGMMFFKLSGMKEADFYGPVY